MTDVCGMSLRITYLHQYFNLPSQPGGTRSYEFARRLAKYGHRVTMITSDRSGVRGPIREQEYDGIRVLWIPVAYDNSMAYARRLGAFASFAVRSASLAARCEADVIFATSTPLTVVVPAMYASWRRRVPWILEVRDLWPEVPIAMGALSDPFSRACARWLAARAYRSAAHVITLSPGMAAGVAAYGVTPTRLTTIPNSCDLDLFGGAKVSAQAFLEERPELQGRRIVLYPGTLGKVNGVQYVVNLAVESQRLDPSVAYVVIGAGGQEHSVRDYARERMVLNRNFFLYPALPKSKIGDAFAAAELCLSVVVDVPALHDNSANKFFDSLAAGRSIAINHEGWLADLIRINELGLVLPATDVAGAAQQITHFLAHRSKDSPFNSRSRQLAESMFDRDALCGELEKLLRQVSDEAKSPSAGR
jgi:glycosyltransferase involved in cell wall biosynthesis